MRVVCVDRKSAAGRDWCKQWVTLGPEFKEILSLSEFKAMLQDGKLQSVGLAIIHRSVEDRYREWEALLELLFKQSQLTPEHFCLLAVSAGDFDVPTSKYENRYHESAVRFEGDMPLGSLKERCKKLIENLAGALRSGLTAEQRKEIRASAWSQFEASSGLQRTVLQALAVLCQGALVVHADVKTGELGREVRVEEADRKLCNRALTSMGFQQLCTSSARELAEQFHFTVKRDVRDVCLKPSWWAEPFGSDPSTVVTLDAELKGADDGQAAACKALLESIWASAEGPKGSSAKQRGVQTDPVELGIVARAYLSIAEILRLGGGE